MTRNLLVIAIIVSINCFKDSLFFWENRNIKKVFLNLILSNSFQARQVVLLYIY